MKNLKSTIFALFCLLATGTAFAGDCPSLSGEYKIASNGGDYSSVKDALQALQCGGVSGPVTFLLEDGRYNEKIEIGNISGTSATNVVSFESAKGTASDVVLTSNTPDASFTMILNGASNVRFENLTFENKTGNTGNVVRLDGVCSNIYFKGVNFDGADKQLTGANNAVIYSTSNGLKNNINIEDCEINNGSIGIYKGAASANTPDTKTNIIGTIFFSQYETAISLSNETAPIISNNVISTVSNYNGYKAVSLNSVNSNTIISNNVINAVFGSYGIYLNNCEGMASSYANVTNNSINVGGQNTMYGLYLTGSTENQVFNFNRIKLTPTAVNSSTQAYFKNASQGSNINLLNNIFFDLNTGGYTILGNTYKDYFNQLPSQSNPSLSVSANGLMIEKVMPAN